MFIYPKKVAHIILIVLGKKNPFTIIDRYDFFANSSSMNTQFSTLEHVPIGKHNFMATIIPIYNFPVKFKKEFSIVCLLISHGQIFDFIFWQALCSCLSGKDKRKFTLLSPLNPPFLDCRFDRGDHNCNSSDQKQTRRYPGYSAKICFPSRPFSVFFCILHFIEHMTYRLLISL